jgi:hypothetical protein
MTARQRGWKVCNGCGRQLALYMFHLNRRGNPQPRCKACHKGIARDDYRKRYAGSWAFAVTERHRKRVKYEADEQHREQKKESARAYRRRVA